MPPEDHIPQHWTQNDWEAKARENPLHAIMTVAEYRDLTLHDLQDGAPAAFLEKGRQIYRNLIERNLLETEKNRRLRMFDYGCGAGRIMNAVIEAGHDACGADISPTMIETCGKIVPGATGRFVVGPDGQVPLPDASCDVSYSFAVVQHIKSLAAHEKAIDEMARITKPNGLLVIQVNCEDFSTGSLERPGHTINFENWSVHFADPDQAPVRVHEQDNWSGVYIGFDRLVRQLNRCGFHLADLYHWSPRKARAMVFVSRKSKAQDVKQPRPDPFARVTAGMYRALLKSYAQVALDRSRLKKQLNDVSHPSKVDKK